MTAAPALRLPLAFVGVLAAFLLLPQIQRNSTLVASFAAACAILIVWLAILWRTAHAEGRRLAIEVSLRPQHYLQAIAHTSIFVYWGFYWRPLQDAAALIAAQIVFAYAFDSLLAWSRRDTYTLGFGPFPIVYSTNLFLRFRDDWFYLQFLMVAVGFLAKELIRWHKEGRRVHVFNPSSFPLALFSLGLIVTGTTGITWGEDIASLLILPPQIYLFIFLVSLPGQFLFRVTTMTLPALLTTYLFSLAYLKITGVYFFFDSTVPIAVFLGMHLLFTDPSTSPRTELGRIMFGILYGASVVGLYALLKSLGAPTFYDKLLQVPIMNLMIKAIDRVAQSKPVAWLNPERIGTALAPGMRSLGYVTLWVIAFSAMSAANGVGDHHPGFDIRFWEQACRADRRGACTNLAVLQSGPCRQGSGWACNELGILVDTGRVEAAPPADLFKRACSEGFAAGCANQQVLASNARDFRHGDPRLQDFAWMLREGKAARPDLKPVEIYARACDRGWMAACGSLAGVYFQGDGVPADKMQAVRLLEKACNGGHAPSCSNLGLILKRGDGVFQDNARALAYLKKACDLGLASACQSLSEPTRPPAPGAAGPPRE
jgi:hypothetical protein